ncbi:MAG: sugar transferase [candidate division Zixibacteria bacterium]|nr:sugar transferase [candidate division Zixibacteria bacterium]
MLYIFIFLISLLLVLVLTPLFRKLAFKKDFLDYPDPRKIHLHPTPLLGGASVFIGFCGGVFLSTLSGYPWASEFSGVLIGGLLVLGLGLWDDKYGMQPGVKFLGQIFASFIFLLVSHSLGSLGFGVIGDLLLFLWMVGLMNAINFLDNMDGLCSGISFIATMAFMLIFIFNGQRDQIILCLALMGALLGFLVYNFPPAKIFLGDAGSMFNGFILSALGILFAKNNSSSNLLLAPMLILSYPIFDVSLVTFTRLKEGRKIYKGGKDHSSHRLMNLGFHLKKTLGSIYLISLSLGIIGVLVFSIFESPWKVLIAFWVGLLLAILGTYLHRSFARVGEKLWLIFLDVISINSSFLFFYWLRFESGLFSTPIVIPLSEYIIPAIWITFYWLVLFAILGLYELRSELSLKVEWDKILKSVILGIMIFSVLSLKFITFRFVLLYTLSLSLFLLSLRTFYILINRTLYSRGIRKRKSLILGTKANAQKLNKFLKIDFNPGFKVIGFVSEDKEYPKDLRVVGCLDDLDNILKKTRAEVLILALDQDFESLIVQILKGVEEVEADIVIKEEQVQLFSGLKKAKFYKGFWVKVYPAPLKTWEWGAKRMLDFIISLFLILVLSPLWLLISFFISTDFTGGILLRRRFLGKGGKPFELFSFNSGPLDSQSKLSKFLRSYWLEKLPDLLNVLKGEMSLVGPQPEEESSDGYSLELSDYYKRIELKPGIFSLKKKRKETLVFSENTIKGMIEDNLLYAEKVSLLSDFKIILNQIFSPILRRQDV